MSATCIGSRYVPHKVLRIDTQTGTYEALNADPDQWQAVLLAKPRPRRLSNGSFAGLCLLAAVAIYVWGA